MNNTLTSIKGVRVGNSTHLDKLTGCTLIVFDKPTLTSFKAFGGSVASYNTTAIQNGSNDIRIHGIFLTGGSTYGLGAVGEINTYLAEHDVFSQTYAIRNVFLVGATILDLGTRIAQYDYLYGREAAENLSSREVPQGNIGAGTGASVGKYKLLTDAHLLAPTKSGLGCATVRIGENIIVSALSVVNAKGNIIGTDGNIIAGNRSDTPGEKFTSSEDIVSLSTSGNYNTTLTVVVTNYNLKTRENCEKIALFGTHGQTRAIDPLNTSQDGDIVFVSSTQEFEHFLLDAEIAVNPTNQTRMEIDALGNATAKAVRESIVNACVFAESVQGDWAYKGVVPNLREI